jgi:4-hydroxybenzoate polyprenyltransferase
MKEILIKLKRCVKQYFGWRNWAILTHNSIIENLFVVFYIAICRDIIVVDYFTDLFIFIVFSMFSTTFGYLVNDFADIDLDARHGKINTFTKDSKLKAGAIVVFFGILSILFGLRFVHNQIFAGLWIIWILLTTFYSLKPLRLKEKGKIGLAVVVLAQRVFPILLLFTAFDYNEFPEFVIFTLYVLFRGLSSDLNHQIEDYRNDALTETQTFAVDTGLDRAEKFFRFSLEIEKICLLASLSAMFLSSPGTLQFFGISLLLPPLIAGMVLVILAWFQTSVHHVRINPFESGRKDIFQFIHHGFPSVILPFYMLLILMILHWQFIGIIAIMVIYRKMYSVETILNSFPLRIIRNLKVIKH